MKKNLLMYTNAAIFCVILMGFGVASFQSYDLLLQVKKSDIENISTLTADGIYSKNAILIASPVQMSLVMAHDTFLREWLQQEPDKNVPSQEHMDKLVQFLSAYRNLYNFDSVFLVSQKTRHYYHYNGVIRDVDPDNPDDQWFFAFNKESEPYRLNVDIDHAADKRATIFVNCKLTDANGEVLAVVGVGMRTSEIQNFLRNYEKQYGIQAFFVDEDGKIQVTSSATSIEKQKAMHFPDVSQYKSEIMGRSAQKINFWTRNDKEIYYVIRYVDSLRWFLVVAHDTVMVNKKYRDQFIFNIFISLISTAGVLLIITYLVRRFNKRLFDALTCDEMTTLPNRGQYETRLAYYTSMVGNWDRIGLGIFDLNYLKYVNDRFGHKQGDDYLAESSRLLRESFPQVELFRIGGDEFAALWHGIDAEAITRSYAELTKKMAALSATKTYDMSLAFGYAFYDGQTDKDLSDTFKRADVQMYADKVRQKTHTPQEYKNRGRYDL